MEAFDLKSFVQTHVIIRPTSLLCEDLSEKISQLEKILFDRSLLVIGGAGSIGSSFIKAALHFHPERLVVVDTNENGLTELTRDLRSKAGQYIPPTYLTYPMNFGDPAFRRMLQHEGPFDIVANFAAHKHVRSEKDPFAIEAMVRNNVLLGRELLEMLLKQPPQHFFCVSTDKATNPVNVMGATKKLMEDMILAYADELPITTARFANVAFSNGSLLDGFRYRLEKRQPLSSPSDVRRYFVSPQESGEICLLACLLGKPGEIFFPKLEASQMKNFADIAEAFLRAHGYEPLHCATEEEARQKASELNHESTHWPVYFFPTDTSGEKPFEEFYAADETVDLDRFHALGVIQPTTFPSRDRIHRVLAELQRLFERDHLRKQDIIEALSAALPTFSHLEKGKNLDQRM